MVLSLGLEVLGRDPRPAVSRAWTSRRSSGPRSTWRPRVTSTRTGSGTRARRPFTRSPASTTGGTRSPTARRCSRPTPGSPSGSRPTPGTFYLIGRLWSIAYAVAAIPLVFLLGRRCFSTAVGLAGAALWAVLPLAVSYGRVVRTDSAGVFFALLVAAADRAAARPCLGSRLCPRRGRARPRHLVAVLPRDHPRRARRRRCHRDSAPRAGRVDPPHCGRCGCRHRRRSSSRRRTSSSTGRPRAPASPTRTPPTSAMTVCRRSGTSAGTWAARSPNHSRGPWRCSP